MLTLIEYDILIRLFAILCLIYSNIVTMRGDFSMFVNYVIILTFCTETWVSYCM